MTQTETSEPMNFVEVYDDVLSESLCAQLRDLFNTPGLAQPGVTGAGVELDKKISQDIMLNQHPQLSGLLDQVIAATRERLVHYFDKYHFALIAPLALKVRDDSGAVVNLTHDNFAQLGRDKTEQFMQLLYRLGGIQAQKYEQGVGNYQYWHCEVFPQPHSHEALHRSLLFMFYLNDVEQGGETEFYYQNLRIQPKRGRMVVAPAYFTHTHRGLIPQSGDKYILTSWVLLNRGQDLFRAST
ncbi:MAG: 2OG-Fe(II) oxygenase [Firmicutes bacterium]|nr:2OG-Fe(II) oxygenase [Bacillota bacterium]